MTDHDLRDVLQKESGIFLRKKKGNNGYIQEEFVIDEVIGQGSCAICYKAENVAERRGGTLKELYPMDSRGRNGMHFDLERRYSPDRHRRLQVYTKESSRARFLQLRKDFLCAYDKIHIAKETDSDLNDYIPAFDIYEGIPDPNDCENYTVYVWTPNDPNIISFDKYLEVVCAETKQGENRLFHLDTILRAIKDLTRSIRSLHCSQLFHLDINPRNFGIRLYDKKPKSSITLFDVNSVFSKDGGAPVALGTDGFRSPELADCNFGKIGQASDFYSIGATLFYSLVIKDGKNVTYSDDKFDDIALYLQSSELFDSYAEDADEIRNVLLRSQLVKILRQCLDRSWYFNRFDRDQENYSRPSPLIDDLDEAIRMLNLAGSQSLSKEGSVVRTVVRDKQDALDKEIPTGSTGALQWLLYQKPLYDYTVDGKIDILVLGAGTYATKFLDLALEMSQIRDCYANITVASNDIEKQKQAYLDSRPEFPNYFDIDKEKAKKVTEPYGSLTFVSAEFSEGKSVKKNRSVIDEICRSNPQAQYSYIFIALHSDRLNYTMMQVCREAFKDRKALISFVLFGDLKKDSRKKEVVINPDEFKADGGAEICPVDVKDTLSRHKAYEELRRMAFNIHLLWEGSLSDIRDKEAEFKKPYNFNSSISSALSIKYKLHSIDEDFDFFTDPVAGAREAMYRLNGNPTECKAIVRNLVMYEHRRWIVNMISDSWKCPEDFSGLETGTKDKKRRYHPCLVPSEEKGGLRTAPWIDQAYWDTAPDEEVEKLDPLDAMSVRLHRHFAGLAKKVKASDFSENLNAIRLLITGKSDLEHIFNVYVTALNQLVYHKKVNSYSYYLSSFKKLLKVYGKSVDKKAIEEHLDSVQGKVFPVLEALAYTDWKAKDVTIIKNIPFILSYSSDFNLCVPFIVEEKNTINNDGLFKNAAASLMINPASVTFVADCSVAAKDLESFENSVRYTVNTMDNHGLQTKIEFLFLRSLRAPSLSAATKKRILEISPRIRRVDCLDYCERREDMRLAQHDGSYEKASLPAIVKKYLEDNLRSKKRFTAIESNETKISGYLSCCDIFPTYSFDARNQKFDTGLDCIQFSYLPKSFMPHLTIEDMFRFKGKLCSYSEPEMQQDYEYFWGKYKTMDPERFEVEKNELIWKTLCGALKSLTDASDKLIDMNLTELVKESYSEFTCLVPAFARPGVEKLLCEMSGEEIPVFAQGSCIEEYSSQSFRLHAVVSPTFWKRLMKLLAKPYCLVDASQICVQCTTKGYVRVTLNNLIVTGLKKSYLRKKFGSDKLAGRAEDLLREFAEKGYLLNFDTKKVDEAKDGQSGKKEPDDKDKQDDYEISFCYCSPQIKQLLTNEGRLFELYVYYSVLETGYFDEVRCGLQIRWNDKNLTNELDLVLVKGFKTMIVECKACRDISQDFYNKLFAVGMNLGLNNRCLLIVDALEMPNKNNTDNEIQNTRGMEYRIIRTIKDNRSIKKIGLRLKEAMSDF